VQTLQLSPQGVAGFKLNGVFYPNALTGDYSVAMNNSGLVLTGLFP
jgi:hypothetical protein